MKWDKAKAKAKWNHLTEDDLNAIDGNRDRLVAKLQEYGATAEDANKEADEFEK